MTIHVTLAGWSWSNQSLQANELLAMTTTYRRRAMTRKEVLEILGNQGAAAERWGKLIPAKARKETEIWAFLENLMVEIPCGHCQEPIRRRSECIRDHKISLRSVEMEKRREHDQAWNQWYLCHGCNDTKTHKRGLKGLGSDAARHARLRRIEKGDVSCVKPKAKIRSRPFPKSCSNLSTKPSGQGTAWPTAPSMAQKRKILSRPFPKAQKKPK